MTDIIDALFPEEDQIPEQYRILRERGTEAVEDFLKANSDFTADASREKLLLTFNPRGYLKRK